MTLSADWKKYKDSYAKWSLPDGMTQLEKPVKAFNDKVLKTADRAFKALDGAQAKGDAKTFSKLELSLQKVIVEARVARTKAVAELKKVNNGARRAADMDRWFGNLLEGLDHLKAVVAESREHMANPGPQRATEYLPPASFDKLRHTPLTRSAEVIEFANDKAYQRLFADGTISPDLTKRQSEFRKRYELVQAQLKELDKLKTATLTKTELGTQLSDIIDAIDNAAQRMSSCVYEWGMTQENALKKLQPPGKPDDHPQWTVAQKAGTMAADESHRVVGLRLGLKKVFPSQIR
jgi:hypothetical protein